MIGISYVADAFIQSNMQWIHVYPRHYELAWFLFENCTYPPHMDFKDEENTQPQDSIEY